MSDEIKEILDKLKNFDNYKYRIESGRSYKEIDGWEIDLLLDYITNLQEENMKLFTQLEDRAYGQIKFQWKDYKSRCEKAIEYINNLEKDYDINVWQEDKHWAYVLYILTGGDKE